MPKRKATIAGVPITIVLTKGPHLCEGSVVCGEWVSADRTVYVSGQLSDHEQRRTLFHELIHGSISILIGCETLEGICKNATADAEETFVRVVETGLWTAIHENKWLKNYLFNGRPFKS